MVLSLVVEDDMDFLVGGTANVRAKHDKVWRISMHIILLQTAVKQLDITASTVNVLFMLDSELKD
jgi:hypothetical protein